MRIEDFKRWHWIVIGLVVGVVMAYMRTSLVTPDETASYRRGVSAFEFLTNLRRPVTGNGFPWVSDIVVYPPVMNKNYVTAKMLEIQPDGRGIYRLVKFNGEIPFKVARFSDPKSKTYSVRDFLNDEKAKQPNLKYTFAWWELPTAAYALWIGGGLILIGGVWPTLVNVMIGAGLGRKKSADQEYDLDRFGKTPEPAAAPSGRPVVTAEAAGKLQEYQETMEKNLANAGIAMTGDAPVEATAAAGEPEIIKLAGGPVEPAAAIGASEDPKNFKGEYYPVARPVQAKEDK
jgi:hypothetical protein